MTCWKCNTFFCWVCKTKLNRDDPYLHYRDPSSKCFNMLYHGMVSDDEDDDINDFVVLLETDSDDDGYEYSDYDEDENW